MNRATALVPAAICVALASCAPSGNDQRSKEVRPAGEHVVAECAAVANKADTLATVTGRLAVGDATVNQVRSAAADLATTFDHATAATDPALHHADQAMRRVENAATTQPVDTHALRDATGDLLTALGDAPDLCRSSTKDNAAS